MVETINRAQSEKFRDIIKDGHYFINVVLIIQNYYPRALVGSSDNNRIIAADHCIPFRSIKHEEVYSEFEVLFAQLRRLQPVSTDRDSGLKAVLNDLAHAYSGNPVSTWESDWRSEHFRTLKSLRSNKYIVIACAKSCLVGGWDKYSGLVYYSKQVPLGLSPESAWDYSYYHP